METNEKSVWMCSFDIKNRARSLHAERIKTWPVSWFGLYAPVGVWNDGHLHKVHAGTRMHEERTTRIPAAWVHNTAGTEIIAENGKICSEKKLLSGSKLKSVHAGQGRSLPGGGADQQPHQLSCKVNSSQMHQHSLVIAVFFQRIWMFCCRSSLARGV